MDQEISWVPARFVRLGVCEKVLIEYSSHKQRIFTRTAAPKQAKKLSKLLFIKNKYVADAAYAAPPVFHCLTIMHDNYNFLRV